jgi:hypothetical protein
MTDTNHGTNPPAEGPAAAAPSLSYAFTMEVEVGQPVEQGEINGGRCRFIPILGGTVRGSITGTILPGGGDWQTVRPQGLTEVVARYFLRLDDDTVVEVDNQGVRTASAEVIDRIVRGEAVDPDDYYMRTQARFRVAGEAYGWLSRHVFVARGVRHPDQVLVDYYRVD